MSATHLITGIPRSGTSLACRLLDQAEDSLALSEPLKPSELEELAGPEDAISFIGRRLAQVRDGILDKRIAPSTHVRGSLSDARVSLEVSSDGLRAPQGEQGDVAVSKRLPRDFTLFVKHNALFTALLGKLTHSFRCIALVRNPVAVLASWHTVDLPVNRGRLPIGEQFDPALRAYLRAEPDCLQRQLSILDWFFNIYRSTPGLSHTLRYEDIIASAGDDLFRACGVIGHCQERLQARNDNALYASVDRGILLDALVSKGGSWLAFYSEDDMQAAAEALVQ